MHHAQAVLAAAILGCGEAAGSLAGLAPLSGSSPFADAPSTRLAGFGSAGNSLRFNRLHPRTLLSHCF